MIFSLLILLVGALLASGILFEHKRMLTFLATAGLIFEGRWLLMTLINRTFFPTVSLSTIVLFESIIILVLTLVFIKKWTWPYKGTGSGRRDIVILPVLLLVLAGAWLVTSKNGFSDHAWVTHGFYNGDTATLLSLTQRSFLETGLVNENPFAGNGALEYPTLLHASLANFLDQAGIGMDWFRFLPLFTYLQIFLTVPVFFLLWDVLLPEPKNETEKWLGVPSRWVIYLLQAGVVLYVLSLSWDGYIYPQSHFFLTGLFVMLAALLASSARLSLMAKEHILKHGAIIALTIVLMLSNAVTGTAALVLTGVFFLMRVFDVKRRPAERGWQLAIVVVLGLLFLWAMPGNGALQIIPTFSYTAAIDMLRLALPLGILMIGMYQYVSRQSFVAVGSAALMALGLIVFFFSSRNIVIENSSRFFYHAILIGFPLVLAPIVQGWYWVRRELLHTTHSVPEKVAGWFAVGTLLLLLIFPGAVSVASAHDNLMFKDEQVIDTAYRRALWWIEDNTEPSAVFLASPETPFAIPMFTGRTLLRTAYWLSPDDVVLADVVSAFEGDTSAQEQVMGGADYLLLQDVERKLWEPLPPTIPVVFDVNAVVIYKLR